MMLDLLTLALRVAAALAASHAAGRYLAPALRAPTITLQLATGVLAGPALTGLLDAPTLAACQAMVASRSSILVRSEHTTAPCSADMRARRASLLQRAEAAAAAATSSCCTAAAATTAAGGEEEEAGTLSAPPACREVLTPASARASLGPGEADAAEADADAPATGCDWDTLALRIMS